MYKPNTITELLWSEDEKATYRDGVVIESANGTADVRANGSNVVRYAMPVSNGTTLAPGDPVLITKDMVIPRYVEPASGGSAQSIVVNGTSTPSSNSLDAFIAETHAWESGHLAAADPHPQYITGAEMDLFDYLTKSEADSYYVPLSRILTATAPLTGLGTLGADRTIGLSYGAGLTLSSNALVLGTPTGLGVSSASEATGTTHSHAIDWSSDPGAASKILGTNASGHLKLVRLGAGIAPEYPLHASSNQTAQMRLGYTGTGTAVADFLVDNGGNLKLSPYGHVIFNSSTIRPNTAYTTDVGSQSKPFMTGYFTELHAEVLVAREHVVTMGGLFTVGAGGQIVEDLPA